MEEILKEAARQAPALVILLILCISFAKLGAVVVKAFLGQLSETRTDYLQRSSEARGEYLNAIDRFHSDNLEARKLSREAMNENTRAADHQSAAVHELTIEVRELRSQLSMVGRKIKDQ